MKSSIQRPDWRVPSVRPHSIDLSTNVHFDSILNRHIVDILNEHPSFNNYPEQFPVYDAISNFYAIDINRITIGYGATELIDRVFRVIDFENVYIVEPSFQMVEVYCDIYKKNVIHITIEHLLSNIDILPNSLLYIANPNGNDGSLHDISEVIDRFEYVIDDEVYSDFEDRYSLLYSSNKKIIVLKSFSKSLGLAGLRCGFAVSCPEITTRLQNFRSNFIMSSFTSIIIPRVIDMTPDVVSRMKATQNILESTYSCKPSHGNYVLFTEPNKYTERFGCKRIGEYYRMALTDKETMGIL